MTPDTLALARRALADDWQPNIRDVARELATALLQAAAELERMRAVCEAACMWRHGIVRMSDGALIDSDDGSVAQGLKRRPSREVLADAVDAYLAALTGEGE